MKVALVNTLYHPFGGGGAGKSVRELAEGLVRSGHEVQVWTLGPGGGSAREVLNGVEVRRLRSDTAFAPFDAETALNPAAKVVWHASEVYRRDAARFLSAGIETFQPDVVNTHNIAGFGLAAWNVPSTIPLVHTMRDYYLICLKSSTRRASNNCDTPCISCRFGRVIPGRAARRRPDLFVGISQFVVDHHRDFAALSGTESSVVIANAPHIQKVGLKRRVDGLVRFGMLGRLGEDKGTWVALEAFTRALRSTKLNVEIEIAGSGSESSVRRLGTFTTADSRIRDAGRRVDAGQFLASIDALLVPSQWPEPLGRVAMEGALAGAHVVVSDVGGLPESIQHYANKQVVKRYADPDAWKWAIERVLQAPPSRSIREEALPSESVSDRYVRVYRELLDSNTRPAIAKDNR